MTKRLVCIFAVLALLCSPALAEFKGDLKRNVPTTIWVIPPATNADHVVATIVFIGSLVGPLPGGWEVGVYRTITAEPNTAAQVALPNMPPGTTRIIVQVNMCAGCNTVVKVTQGNQQFQDVVNQDTQFAYNVH